MNVIGVEIRQIEYDLKEQYLKVYTWGWYKDLYEDSFRAKMLCIREGIKFTTPSLEI